MHQNEYILHDSFKCIHHIILVDCNGVHVWRPSPPSQVSLPDLGYMLGAPTTITSLAARLGVHVRRPHHHQLPDLAHPRQRSVQRTHCCCDDVRHSIHHVLTVECRLSRVQTVDCRTISTMYYFPISNLLLTYQYSKYITACVKTM